MVSPAIADRIHATTMVPTLRLNSFALRPPYRHEAWEEALSRVPAAVREDWAPTGQRLAAERGDEVNQFGEWSHFLIERMHAAGVPIGAGTDTPIFLSVPGFSLHSELEHLVMAGLSPLEALRAATVRPAEYFSMQDQMGTIDEGKVADLVLLAENPLDDISNTRTVTAVVTKGRFLGADDLSVLVRSSSTD